ncbi:FHA domain-containing protein [Rhynchospora pubera]|uniref:FHA domain-containing protein n=1 Tax=Rhynchospora pubera TaxID=906938 RepID=A0AAV8GLR4_9POAL|nr:FHA domain-containing protein [Rhynchospora pubera]
MEASILQVTVLQGPRNGEILVCDPDSTIQIGRVMRGNNLALRDPGISQKHLCFRFVQADSDSRWFVSDLDTSNGTILNGSPIQASVPVPVSDGDVLEIGQKTKLGVKIVAPKVVEEGNDARGRRRVTRRGGSLGVNLRANSSRVSEERVELKQTPSKVSAPVRGRRNNARAISAVTVNDEEKEGLNSDSGVEMGLKGTKRGREDIVGRNAAGVLNEEVSMDPSQFICSGVKESDQNRGTKLTRNPRKRKSSRVLKEVDTNCLVDSVLEVKEVEVKKKGMGRGKGKGNLGKASTVSEEKENDVNIVLNLDCESTGSDHVAVLKLRKGKKARISADSSTVIEGEGEENVGVERENSSEEGRVDNEKMTLKDWFESMERFLSQAINDECERLIGIIKESARKFDELLESGHDMA